jgi:hypothetical protein
LLGIRLVLSDHWVMDKFTWAGRIKIIQYFKILWENYYANPPVYVEYLHCKSQCKYLEDYKSVVFTIFYSKSYWHVLGQGMAVWSKSLGFGMTVKSRSVCTIDHTVDIECLHCRPKAIRLLGLVLRPDIGLLGGQT